MRIKKVLILLSCLTFAAGIACAEGEDAVLEKVQLRLKGKGISEETAEKVKTQLKIQLKIKSASEIDAEELSGQLADCLNDNYSPDDAVKISLKVREMTREGSPQGKRQMKIMVKDNLAEGVEAENISNSLEALKSAVEKGHSPSEARLKIALAVHYAKAEGLKGKELAERIHEIHNQIKNDKKDWDEEISLKIKAKNKEKRQDQIKSRDKDSLKDKMDSGTGTEGTGKKR